MTNEGMRSGLNNEEVCKMEGIRDVSDVLGIVENLSEWKIPKFLDNAKILPFFIRIKLKPIFSPSSKRFHRHHCGSNIHE